MPATMDQNPSARHRTAMVGSAAMVVMLVLLTLSALAAASPSIALSAVRVDRVDLNVEIIDMLATTRINVTLTNPDDEARELVFSMPLSTTAVLRNVTLVVNGSVLYGIVVDRTSAQTQYNASKEAGQTAALVTSAGRGRLGFNVNLAANAQVSIDFTIAEVLPVVGGLQTYNLPVGALGGTDGNADALTLDVTAASAPGWKSIALSGFTIAPNHLTSNEASWLHEAQDMTLPANLRIDVRPVDDAYRAAMVVSSFDDDASTILALLPAANQPRLPLDVVLVMDRSGSMEGDKIAQARDALATILQQLPTTDRFGLVSFSETDTSFDDRLRDATAENREAGKSWASEIVASGSTCIQCGLDAALRILGAGDSERLAAIVLVTDGKANQGITDSLTLIEHVEAANQRNARIHAVGIGFDQDDAFLVELTSGTRGSYAAIPHTGDVETALTEFYARISSVLLRDVRLTSTGFVLSEMHPAPVPDVYEGSHLVVAGRIDASAIPSQIGVRMDAVGPGGPVVHSMTIARAAIGTGAHADALWARQKAATLEREYILSGNQEQRTAANAQLVELGIRHQIETIATGWRS